jgi:hypothetical protein
LERLFNRFPVARCFADRTTMVIYAKKPVLAKIFSTLLLSSPDKAIFFLDPWFKR